MEQFLERQVVRTAVALVVASAHATSSEVIVEMRDRAYQVLALRFLDATCFEELAQWCADTEALLEHVQTMNAVPHEVCARALALVLKLRVTTLRFIHGERDALEKRSSTVATKKITQQNQAPQVALTENTKKVLEYIKANKNIRTKELVEHFAKQFSSRSTKRYLSELLALKLLQRRTQPDGGVSYEERA